MANLLRKGLEKITGTNSGQPTVRSHKSSQGPSADATPGYFGPPNGIDWEIPERSSSRTLEAQLQPGDPYAVSALTLNVDPGALSELESSLSAGSSPNYAMAGNVHGQDHGHNQGRNQGRNQGHNQGPKQGHTRWESANPGSGGLQEPFQVQLQVPGHNQGHNRNHSSGQVSASFQDQHHTRQAQVQVPSQGSTPSPGQRARRMKSTSLRNWQHSPQGTAGLAEADEHPPKFTDGLHEMSSSPRVAGAVYDPFPAPLNSQRPLGPGVLPSQQGERSISDGSLSINSLNGVGNVSVDPQRREVPSRSEVKGEKQDPLAKSRANGPAVGSQQQGQGSTAGLQTNDAAHGYPGRRDSGGSDVVLMRHMEELAAVSATVRHSWDPRASQWDADTTIKYNGVPKALEMLMNVYKHTSAEMGRVEARIQDAAREANISPAEFSTAFGQAKNCGVLDLITKHHRDRHVVAASNEQVIQRLTATVRDSTRDFKWSAELGDPSIGLEDMVDLLLDHSRDAEEGFKYLDREMYRALGHIPQQKLQTAYADGGKALLELLLAEVHRLRGVESSSAALDVQLRTGALGWINAQELAARQSASEVFQLLLDHFRRIETQTRGSVVDLEGQVSRARSHCTRLEIENQTIGNEVRRLQNLDQEHQRSAAEVTERHKAQLQQLDGQWRASLASSEATHRADLSKKEAALSSARQQHENERMDLVARHDRDMAEKVRQLDTIHEDYRREMAAQKLAFDNKYQDALGDMQDREHIKSMSDTVAGSEFKRLVRLVDTYSRVAWDKRKQASWPVGDRSPHLQTATNPKRVKQLMVQSSIWIILDDRIFATPFAVFGDEGTRLHREWVRDQPEQADSATAISWAKPTADAELRRSDSVKQCLSAVTSPSSTSLSPADQTYKTSYDATLRDTVSEIHAAVETVADCEVARVSEFVRCAAELWLKLASQRYRARVYLPAEAERVLGAGRRAGSAAIHLAVRPELRRRGTAQREDLDREHVIQGCEGEAIMSSRI